jgi:arylsulfate sulfotransferase
MLIMKSKLITIAILSSMVLLVLCFAIYGCRGKTTQRAAGKIVPYSYKVNAHDKSLKGYLLTAPYELFKWNRGQLVIMDLDGHIYLQKQIPGAAYDFRQWKINGKVYYSYIINDTTAYHIKRIALTAGHVVLLDAALNEIKQLHLIPHDDIVINKNQSLDLHDIILFSENHYIAIASYEKKVANIPSSLNASPDVKVAADIIQEVDNDKVTWQWDATKYPEFYTTSTEKNHFRDTAMTQDYLHINSLCLDPRDGNLICSFRSNDQVVKINRHTGNIMWRLGGKNSDFPLTDSMVFQRQHHATLIDNNKTLLILDNGDSTKRKTSRVLEFTLDEKHKKVTAFSSFTIPAPYNQYMGSVTKRNGHYFIGGGTGKYVLEIDPKTGKKGFDYTTNQLSYRDYWVESIYGFEKSNK